jgi:hypothetical protein
MIRGVVIPVKEQPYIPSDFGKDAMACLDRMDLDMDEITVHPVVFLDEEPPFYEGPLFRLVKNQLLLDGTNEEWVFTFSMPFDMMRAVLKNDPSLTSVLTGGALPIGNYEDPVNAIYDKRARHRLIDQLMDERANAS